MKFLFASLFLLASISHDIQVAYFKIYEKGDQLVVDFVFEREDLLEALGQKQSDLEDAHIHSYLEEKFAVRINGKRIEIGFNYIDVKEKHVHLSGSLMGKIETINTIEIDNHCLLDIYKHSNIVELRLFDQERDFLMNAERTNIKINY